RHDARAGRRSGVARFHTRGTRPATVPELRPASAPAAGPTGAVDPLLIAGVSLLPTTAVTLGIGGWLLRPEPTETRCGITGECFDYTPPSGRIARAHG